MVVSSAQLCVCRGSACGAAMTLSRVVASAAWLLLFVVLSALRGPLIATADEGGWRNGRATFYGNDGGEILRISSGGVYLHVAACVF